MCEYTNYINNLLKIKEDLKNIFNVFKNFNYSQNLINNELIINVYDFDDIENTKGSIYTKYSHPIINLCNLNLSYPKITVNYDKNNIYKLTKINNEYHLDVIF